MKVSITQGLNDDQARVYPVHHIFTEEFVIEEHEDGSIFVYPKQLTNAGEGVTLIPTESKINDNDFDGRKKKIKVR